MIVDVERFKPLIASFAALDVPDDVVNRIDDAHAFDWMRQNVPWFECPDAQIEKTFAYRWWTFRKHVKDTPAGTIVTEFLAPVRHAGLYNSISCALCFHLAEGRWIRDEKILDEYSRFWFRADDGKPEPRFHRYSQWLASALVDRARVTGSRASLDELFDEVVADYRKWESEKELPEGLYWQYDVWDGMEESISGGRKQMNARPTISSYMAANAQAIAHEATRLGREDLAKEFATKATRIRGQIESKLWDADADFYKVRFEDGTLSDAREAIGFIPWQFGLPAKGREAAWKQFVDPQGFHSPAGLTTAERRHPGFRTHGVGHCEWDGACWPFATSQTLVALANVLRHYDQSFVTRADYLKAIEVYAHAHRWPATGEPYIGEYHDEVTGEWLKGPNPRSRFYNHSTFCDLIITGLVGLVPRDDDVIELDPLLPADAWPWFCLDGVPYHGRTLTIVWDRDGTKYRRGVGLTLSVDGERVASAAALGRLEARMA